jgi:hypothetical protein
MKGNSGELAILHLRNTWSDRLDPSYVVANCVSTDAAELTVDAYPNESRKLESHGSTDLTCLLSLK